MIVILYKYLCINIYKAIYVIKPIVIFHLGKKFMVNEFPKSNIRSKR